MFNGKQIDFNQQKRGQMTHYTFVCSRLTHVPLSGHKHLLYEVRTANVSPKQRYRLNTNFALLLPVTLNVPK